MKGKKLIEFLLLNGTRPIRRPKPKREDKIKMNLGKYVRKMWTGQKWLRYGTMTHGDEHSGFTKSGIFQQFNIFQPFKITFNKQVTIRHYHYFTSHVCFLFTLFSVVTEQWSRFIIPPTF